MTAGCCRGSELQGSGNSSVIVAITDGHDLLLVINIINPNLMKSLIHSLISLFLLSAPFISSAGDITIRARGNCGTETMVLEVNGSNVATFTNVSTALSNYSWSSYTGGTIRVKFTNDAGGSCDRNLFVDYINVCGNELQTETSATRTGCGDPQWLWCNGQFDFGNPGCNSGGGSGGLSVRARGNCGTETMVIEVDGSDVAAFTNISTTTTDYAWNSYSGGGVKVKFTNDAGGSCDRNLFVDYIIACGNQLETESSATRTGCGDSQWLWCNGSFDFGSPACGSGGGSQTPVETHGALAVNGNRVVAESGSPFSLAGSSFFWSNNGWGGERFYNADVVEWLKTDWKTSIVRAAMGVEDAGGYISDPTGNKQKVKTVVDAAIDRGLYVIIDWHSHHAENYQSQAISFFEEMAVTYGNTPNVIYEIYNEPQQQDWNTVIRPYAQAVADAIRAIDPDNLIVVGSSTWSQDVDIAATNPVSGSNIAYSLHFYAGTHGQWNRDKAIAAMNNGAAIMVTEWGTVNANGDGTVAYDETNNWMDFLQDYNISHCNWAVNDKDEGASIVNPGASTTGGWAASDLTASGTFVRDIIRNWGSAGARSIDAGPEELSLQPLDEPYLKLYPNPASFTLFIESKEACDVYVYDMEGRLMLKQLAQKDKRILDVSTFKKGVYLFIVNDGSRMIVEKINIK